MGADLADFDHMIHRYAGSFTRDVVDLNARLAAVLVVCGHDLDHGCPFSRYLDDIADHETKLGEVGWVQPRQAAA
jgi:hypothetical protein